MKSPNPYVILLMQQALKKQGIIVIFLFLFNLLTLLGRDSTFMDAAFLTFWGYGYGYANVLEFLGFLIFTLTPIYFFSGNLTQHSISQTNFVVIRLRRKKNWLAIIQASFVISVLLYFFAYFFTLFVSSILLGRFTLEAEKATALLRGVIPMIDVTESIFKAMGLRALELCCVQEILLLIYACVRNISFSFFMIFLMYLPLLGINGVWYPFGASSIQRFIVQDNAITWVAIYLAIYITGYLLLRQCGIKKIFN